jgi:hypothetical protein
MPSFSRAMFRILENRVGTERLYRWAAHARRAELTGRLSHDLGDRVSAGPFAGMVLVEASSWGDGDRCSKLLGSYEAELHAGLRRAVGRGPATVVNVGCAEGYYAIGLARLLPRATVFAFDINERAQELCALGAALNGVADRVVVGGLCTSAMLAELTQRSGRTLLVIDCEGGERELLDPACVPNLAACDILVECHDFIDRAISATLEQRLCPTHQIEVIVQAGRDPNRLPPLRYLPEGDRWLLMDEGRPEVMSWFACWAR